MEGVPGVLKKTLEEGCRSEANRSVTPMSAVKVAEQPFIQSWSHFWFASAVKCHTGLYDVFLWSPTHVCTWINKHKVLRWPCGKCWTTSEKSKAPGESRRTSANPKLISSSAEFWNHLKEGEGFPLPPWKAWRPLLRTSGVMRWAPRFDAALGGWIMFRRRVTTPILAQCRGCKRSPATGLADLTKSALPATKRKRSEIVSGWCQGLI